MIRGKRVEEKIGYKMKGIRYRPMMVGVLDEVREKDPKVVKIKGFEYRIPFQIKFQFDHDLVCN